jgi:hypothetical protein
MSVSSDKVGQDAQHEQCQQHQTGSWGDPGTLQQVSQTDNLSVGIQTCMQASSGCEYIVQGCTLCACIASDGS